MSVDMYAVCPCGSGKKIKFCKCKSSVHQLDEVLQMVEGGQMVPALDRMSSILAEDPEAAWVLAIRGRLLMELREYDSLAENAERFIRLQPSNPLAITQRAASKLFQADLDGATEDMLEALTESGQDVDSFVLDVAGVLAFSLTQAGVYLTARVYATLGIMAQEYEGTQTSLQVLRSINQSPMVNGYLKQIPEPKPRPADAPWAERFDEALTLLRSNKVTLAESKFESLQRVAPESPAVIGNLLTCAIWRGDVDAQVSRLKKLSECDSLSDDERIAYRAMSVLVDPKMSEISVATVTLRAEVDNADEANMAMQAADRLLAYPPEALQNFRTSEEDVPPKAAFAIADRDIPEVETGVPQPDAVPESLGMAILFGKQTDRAARIEVLSVRADQKDAVLQTLRSVDDSLTWDEEADGQMPLVLLADPALVPLRLKAKPEEVRGMQDAIAAHRVPHTLTTVPLPILDGSGLQSAAEDDSLRMARTVVVRIIEQYDSIAGDRPELLARVRELSGVADRPPLTVSAEQVETIDNIDLDRVEPGSLDLDSLLYLLQRARQIGSSATGRRMASEIISRDVDAEKAEIKAFAYTAAIAAEKDPSRALELIEESKAFAEKHSLDNPQTYFAELALRLTIGDGEGFQKVLQTITDKYQNNPEIMARLQQMLMQYGLLRPDGSPRGAPAPGSALGSSPGMPGAAADPAAGGGGGLWTPDQGSPSAAPPPASGGGGSKIILPGMD